MHCRFYIGFKITAQEAERRPDVRKPADMFYKSRQIRLISCIKNERFRRGFRMEEAHVPMAGERNGSRMDIGEILRDPGPKYREGNRYHDVTSYTGQKNAP